MSKFADLEMEHFMNNIIHYFLGRVLESEPFLFWYEYLNYLK